MTLNNQTPIQALLAIQAEINTFMEAPRTECEMARLVGRIAFTVDGAIRSATVSTATNPRACAQANQTTLLYPMGSLGEAV